MSSSFDWPRMGLMLLLLSSMFAVPIWTFWQDDRKERRAQEEAATDGDR